MSRLMACLLVSLSAAAGQTTVEYGLGAARAATTTAPLTKGAGKAMGGLADRLDKALKTDAKPAAAATAKPAVKESAANTAVPAAHTPPPPAPIWEDPSGIQTGLSYGELVRRFGPASLEIAGADGKSLTYSGKNGTFEIQVRDEKVTSVEKPKS